MNTDIVLEDAVRAVLSAAIARSGRNVHDLATAAGITDIEAKMQEPGSFEMADLALLGRELDVDLITQTAEALR